jgi:uncharacterized SAM-dependent methyltransferase
MQLNLNNNPSGPSQQVIDDYTRFFNGEKNDDMLKYEYAIENDAFGEIINKCKAYYLYNDEILNIKQNISSFCKLLDGPLSIFELGPGPKSAVKKKSLPIIKSLNFPVFYTAIDTSFNFAKTASKLVENCKNVQNTNQIIKHFFELNSQDFQYSVAKKAIFFFGNTIGNFSGKTLEKFFSSISNFLNPGEVFIFSADMNQNIDELMQAYNNEYNKLSIRNIILYAEKVFNLDLKDKFEEVITYNKNNKSIEFLFRSKTSFSVNIANVKLFIEQGDFLYGGKSKKFTRNKIILLLIEINFYS